MFDELHVYFNPIQALLGLFWAVHRRGWEGEGQKDKKSHFPLLKSTTHILLW